MGVGYDPELTSRREFDDIEFHDQRAVCRFVGFNRYEDGGLVVKTRHDTFQYYQEGEQWYRRGKTKEEGPTPVSEEDIPQYEHVYPHLEVVWPLDVAGELTLPREWRVKGIAISGEDADVFSFTEGISYKEPRWRTGLWSDAIELGFDHKALDVTSPIVEKDDKGFPLYISEEAKTLEPPLTAVQILEKVVEPKLLAAAAAGRLVEVTTGEQSNFIRTLTALSPEEAEKYRAMIASAGDETEREAENLRTAIRELATSGKVAAPEVMKLAREKQTYDDSQPILPQLALPTLQHIWEQIAGEPKEEPSL